MSKTILDTIDSMRLLPGLVIHEDGHEYTIEGSNFNAKIKVDFPKWIGLEFNLTKNGSSLISYSINTDLYELDDPSNEDFLNEIVEKVCEFLQAIEQDTILAGEIRGKPAMIIPYRIDPVVVKVGLFSLTTQKTIKNVEMTKNKGKFTSLARL